MTSDDRTHALSRAAHRAARGPAPLVATLLEDWRRAFQGSAAEALAVSEWTVVELALCRRPRDGSWLGDTAEIAAELGIENDRLVSLLRAAETVERLKSAHQVAGEQPGRLMAARDHDEED